MADRESAEKPHTHPAQAEVSFDIGALEARLRGFFVLEPMQRMTLSIVWLLYWFMLPMAVLILAFGAWNLLDLLLAWLGTADAALGREQFGLVMVSAFSLLGMVFMVASIAALLGLNRRLAQLALPIGPVLLLAPAALAGLVLYAHEPGPAVWAHLALSSLAGAWIAWAYVHALWDVIRLSPAERKLLKPEAIGVFPRRKLRALTWIPPSIDLIESRWTQALVAVTLVVGAGFYLVIPWQLTQAPHDFVDLVGKAIGSCARQPPADTPGACERAALQHAVRVSTATYLLAAPLCLLAARGVLAWAQNRLVFSVGQVMRQDSRPPILFLRSFRDERIRLQHPRTTWLGRISQSVRPRNELEHLVLDQFSPSGPVVTVGNPQDAFPRYGAAREYLSHQGWHARVEALWHQSRCVVVAIDQTEGVLWEIQSLVASGLASRCLFLLHPRFEVPAANMQMLDHVRALQDMAHRVPSVGGPPDGAPEAKSAVVGWYVDDEGTLHVARAARFTARTYGILLKWFDQKLRAAAQEAEPIR